MSKRMNELNIWLKKQYGDSVSEPLPITNDASFRRYFRIYLDGRSHIVMDAPPDKENNHAYLDVVERLRAGGLNVPEIPAQNLELGFFVISDLGGRLYLSELNENNVERLYGDALGALAAMQVCVSARDLPLYDLALLHQEMNLFPDWLLTKHLKLDLTAEQRRHLQDCFDFLAAEALRQPQVFVHRDYHSRNLLVHEKHNPAVLDFQDAVLGPVTYDLASLLRDCYIVWPRRRVEEWVRGYYELAVESGIIEEEQVDATDFLRWFDLMGLQRHIKVAGIFARLYHRDGKSAYLNDIPVTLNYILDVAGDYPETSFLRHFVSEQVLPAYERTPRSE